MANTFSTDMSLHLNGEEARISFVEGGHSDGDSFIVFNGANIIHTGDIYFSLGYPFIDLNSGGTIAGVLEGLWRIIDASDDETKIIPGHGGVATKADVQIMYDIVKTVRDRVAEMKSNGMSLEEVQAAGPSAEWDEQWGQWFVPEDFLVMTIYETLE